MEKTTILVHVSSDFTHAFQKLPFHIQRLAIKKDNLFRAYPFHPQLRCHKLKGELEGFWSYSVNYSYRVLFRFITNKEVLYYDIGTHDIYG